MSIQSMTRAVDRPRVDTDMDSASRLKAGRRNQLTQRVRLFRGRLAWVQTVAAFAALAQFNEKDRAEAREARVRPIHLGILARKRVMKADGTVEYVTLSEHRREHWPEPAPKRDGYNTERYERLGKPRAWAARMVHDWATKLNEGRLTNGE